jgi:cell division protein FtsB
VDEPRDNALKADNARLQRQLAGALKENAKLKKDLADLRDDNSLLKDLAAKKTR